ncbi:unnamed protein product [Chondrus crispus]|uniref:Uncharacterized protein n=1 Tax=Chondrus crispus TaxID=2769 RepID=S0F356_CHOCR|nr:unnamed protein product [Chondrus crispus]CDF77412.1 unnamed protein product [Chondrus crispus]|eukprot:XP_005712286.1 unnamed protein product [Chondrus crispus]
MKQDDAPRLFFESGICVEYFLGVSVSFVNLWPSGFEPSVFN